MGVRRKGRQQQTMRTRVYVYYVAAACYHLWNTSVPALTTYHQKQRNGMTPDENGRPER
jgi:hypothetical protein